MPDWNIRTYEELKSNLRNWSSFKDECVYDYNGMATLLVACIENLQQYAREAELRALEGTLDSEHLVFLERLIQLAREGEE